MSANHPENDALVQDRGTSTTDVVIIGGGIAGLTAAVALSDAGLQVTVLEAGERLGGRAQSWDDGATGDRVDIGPHILLNQYRNLLQLLRRLGTDDQVIWRKDAFLTLVDQGQPTKMRVYPLPPPLHFLPGMFKLKQVGLRDLASNWRVAWLAMRINEADVAALDATPAAELLARLGVTPRFIEWFWASACIAILNVPVERCSAGALLRFFKHMIGHRNLRVGFPAGGLGDLFTGPAAALLRGQGAVLHVRTPVAGIETSAAGVTGVRLENGRRIAAQQCIAALPPAELAELLPETLRRSFVATEAFEPSPYISLYLWFGRKLTKEPFWARVWSPDSLTSDFYDLSNIRPGWQERPSVIAANIIYSHRANGMSDEEVIAGAIAELAEFLPAAAQVPLINARVHRLAMAIPCPYPGTEVRRPTPQTPVPGLVLAGDWTATRMPCSMESASCSGYRAAEVVLAARNRPRVLALPLAPTEGLAGWMQRRG